MSSTNKTTNYELSQFISTDKPAWLSDYNGDMGKIDTAIHTAASTATGADGKADANTTAIGTLANLTTTAKTSLVAAINEVDSNADTAQNTANSAVTAASAANTNIAKFNLSSKSTLSPTTNKGSIDNNNTYVQFATDTTGSIFKVYGRIQITGLSGQTGTLNITLGSTSLRPTTAYDINTGVIFNRVYSAGNTDTVPRNLHVATDGTISIAADTASLGSSVISITVIIPPCLYFNSDFSDQ